MTPKQDRVINTLIYFLERYKKSVLKSEKQSGFEEIVFDQMIEAINELRDENKRLNALNKPKIIKGEDSE